MANRVDEDGFVVVDKNARDSARKKKNEYAARLRKYLVLQALKDVVTERKYQAYVETVHDAELYFGITNVELIGILDDLQIEEEVIQMAKRVLWINKKTIEEAAEERAIQDV